MSKKTFLISGIGSGLGKFLHENIPNSIGFTRDNKKQILELCRHVDDLIILHCAFNTKKTVSDHLKYLDDNFLLTKELSRLNYTKFIYFSSIDVYDKPDQTYAFFKLLNEQYLSNLKNTLILRLSCILGSTIRSNSLAKILSSTDRKLSLSLSGESNFNYILQNDILEYILSSKNDFGVNNFVSEQDLTLKEISEKYDKHVDFGHFSYTTKIDKTVNNLNPYNKRNAYDTIDIFKRMI